MMKCVYIPVYFQIAQYQACFFSSGIEDNANPFRYRPVGQTVSCYLTLFKTTNPRWVLLVPALANTEVELLSSREVQPCIYIYTV